MDIWETDKLILFLAFFIPGFISIKVYQLIYPGTERPTTDQVTDAIAYSCINYAVLAAPIILVENSKLSVAYPYWYAAFYALVLFIGPILWVVIWKWVRTRDFFQRNAPHPTAKPWDYVFSKRKVYWAKVTLQDKTVIGGLYGGNSFTSSAPAEEQIYLEETWVLNDKGGFVRRKNDTGGVLIIGKDISFIEFRNYGAKNEQREATDQ